MGGSIKAYQGILSSNLTEVKSKFRPLISDCLHIPGSRRTEEIFIERLNGNGIISLKQEMETSIATILTRIL